MIIEIGKVYNGRKVLSIENGYNMLGVPDRMVGYIYDTDKEVDILYCSLSTFKKHANKFGF